jgi:hypothetical protein
MSIETLDDIVEQLADGLNIYGIHTENPQFQYPRCCRVHFTSHLQQRIRRAVTLADKQQGCLMVGTTGAGEVVINHGDIDPDKDGIGHIVFSPAQARDLARLLNEKADEASKERKP